MVLLHPSGGDGHCPQEGLAIHHIAVHGHDVRRLGAALTAPSTIDDHKVRLYAVLMAPVLKPHEIRAQVESGAAGSAQFLERWCIAPGVDDK